MINISARRAYFFMLKYQEEKGRPPTLDEIADAVGFASRSAAAYAVKVLKANGLVQEIGEPREARRFRALPVSHVP